MQMDNEVEVWSHSPDCGIHIKNTPDSFTDRPGVAVLENNQYVCGGLRIETNSTIDRDRTHITPSRWGGWGVQAQMMTLMVPLGVGGGV